MQTLNQLSIGQYGSIEAVPNNKLLSPLGLRPGKSVKMHAKSPLGGPYILEVDGRLLAIARQAAAEITVDGRCVCAIPGNAALDGAS